MEKTTPNKYKRLVQDKRPHPCKYDVITGGTKQFQQFCKLHPTINITYKEYKQIVIEINLYYIKHLLDFGNMVFLPSGLGKMMIQKNKRTIKRTKDGKGTVVKAPINWGESYRQGHIVYHLNEASDGYAYRYNWFKKSSYLGNTSIWSMTMTHEARKLLGERINSNEKDYKGLYRELNSSRKNKFIKRIMSTLN